MSPKKAYIFGYGKHASSLADGLKKDGYDITVIETEDHKQHKALKDGHKQSLLIDVTDDSEIEKLKIDEDSYVICIMDDAHLNVFLTLSLRVLYPQIKIIAISSCVNITQKLKMAGATMVIDLYQVSAIRINNILNKSVATKLIDSFVSDESDISFREIEIPVDSFLDGMMAEDIDFSSYGILLIGLVDMELSHKLIFITNAIKHKLDSGDILVCIGYDRDLDQFEEMICQREARI